MDCNKGVLTLPRHALAICSSAPLRNSHSRAHSVRGLLLSLVRVSSELNILGVHKSLFGTEQRAVTTWCVEGVLLTQFCLQSASPEFPPLHNETEMHALLVIYYLHLKGEIR